MMAQLAFGEFLSEKYDISVQLNYGYDTARSNDCYARAFAFQRW